MRTAAICPTCATFENALCVIYNGPYLPNLNISPLESLESALIKINLNTVTTVGAGNPTASPTHLGQFYVNTTTGVIFYATSLGLGPASWTIIGNGLGFTAENVVNKTTSASDIIAYASSIVKYPSVKSIKDYVDQSINAVDLQTVLNNGHDLLNEINTQGTNAGGGTFSGTNVNAFGLNTAANNSGSHVNAMGNGTAFGNTGSNVNAFGDSAGVSNTFNNVTLLGYATTAGANDQLVFSNGAGFNARISNTNLTANRTYQLPNAAGTIALTSNITTATLQTVTAGANKDLTNGINLQGTGAGTGNTGTSDINAFGTNAALNNQGQYVNAIGNQAVGSNTGGNTGNHVNGIGQFAAYNNGGDYINAMGISAASGNSGDVVVAIGNYSAENNTGDGVVAIGSCGVDNTGDYVNAIGYAAASNNTGSQVNAMGQIAAESNTGSNVNAFGNAAGQNNTISGATIFSNASLPSYANHAAAAAAITVLLGGSPNCTYLYHNQATNSIGAVRL